MFAICRVNSLTGAVKYLSEACGWSFDLRKAFLFVFSFDAVDFLHWRFPSSPHAPFFYEVREVRPVVSVGGAYEI